MTEFERMEKFKSMFKGLSLFKDPTTMDTLKNVGFFLAPASINHHGAYSGALFDHSLAVTVELLNLTKKLNLVWDRDCSPYIVGMFHDLCKIDNYRYNEQKSEWEYNPKAVLSGHGEKSVIMFQQLLDFPLTEEEMLCIRWHMGAFDDKGNWEFYGRAVEKYPNVLYTHTADMIAARVKQI